MHSALVGFTNCLPAADNVLRDAPRKDIEYDLRVVTSCVYLNVSSLTFVGSKLATLHSLCRIEVYPEAPSIFLQLILHCLNTLILNQDFWVHLTLVSRAKRNFAIVLTTLRIVISQLCLHFLL